MAYTWRCEVRCPYCGEDLTRLPIKERINHKLECHIRHNPEYVIIPETTQNRQNVTLFSRKKQ